MVALVLLMVLQATAPVAVAAASTPGQGNGPPDGMVGVPNAAVSDKIPDYAQGKVPDASAFRGSVMTDAHADTLAVEVTTRAAAQGRANACRGNGAGSPPFCEDPTLALNVSDDVNHDGRRVAVPKDVLADALGYEPTTATVVHESGREYDVAVRERGSLYVFDVPQFSTNTVTFDGEVELGGDPATDGASYSYDLSDMDSASGPNITLTGETVSEWDNVSATGLGDGDTLDVHPDGNLDPTGPGGEPEIALTGYSQQQSNETHQLENTNDDLPIHEYDDPIAPIATVRVKVYNHQSEFDRGFSGIYYDDGTQNLTISNGDTLGPEESKWYEKDISVENPGGPVEIKVPSDKNIIALNKSVIENDPATDVEATIGGETVTFGNFSDGETKTKSVDLATTDETVEVSLSGSAVDAEARLKERVETRDPSVEVNGETAAYPGVLADGETANLSVSADALQNGTNRVNVSVSDGTLSDGAPTPAVGFDYSHDARDDQSVSYSGETWSERYNISRAWGNANQNATVTVPFEGNVVANRDLRVYINGTETGPTYSEFDGTELEVGLGDLDSQTKTRVVANGSKVVVRNGSIQVLGPTMEGNDLNTRFKVTSADDGFRIDVSGTASGDRVHYLHNATWTPASDYVRVENSGSDQYLHVPNASAGSTATARTLPLAVNPQNDVELAVVDPTEPKFKLRPGRVSGDAVDLTYYDTNSGSEYRLLDEDNDKIAASDTAESPVHFSVSSDEETIYSIGVADSGGSSGGGGGGGGRDRTGVTDLGNEPLASPIVMIVVAAAVILVGAWVASRTGLSVRWVAGVGVLVALGTLETLRPGTVTHPVEDFLGGASDVAPVLWLAAGIAALLTVYGLYSRYGKPPRVVLNRGGR